MNWKILFLVFTLSSSQIPALAHVNSINNGIEITMHIEPNDAPTTDQPANFKIFFNDAANKFRGENCDCFYTLKFGQSETKLPLQVFSKETYDYSNFGINFDREGAYTIIFSGKPKDATTENNKFKDFEIPFNFRVDQKAGENIKDSIWLYYAAYIVIVMVLFYLAWISSEILGDRKKGS